MPSHVLFLSFLFPCTMSSWEGFPGGGGWWAVCRKPQEEDIEYEYVAVIVALMASSIVHLLVFLLPWSIISACQSQRLCRACLHPPSHRHPPPPPPPPPPPADALKGTEMKEGTTAIKHKILSSNRDEWEIRHTCKNKKYKNMLTKEHKNTHTYTQTHRGQLTVDKPEMKAYQWNTRLHLRFAAHVHIMRNVNTPMFYIWNTCICVSHAVHLRKHSVSHFIWRTS